MARMKSVLAILLVAFVTPCCAQSACDPASVSRAAARVSAVQQELRQNDVGEMEDTVSPAIAGQMTRLKEALSDASDAALACEGASVNLSRLRNSLIGNLHASQPLPAGAQMISKGDPRFDEINGAYGHNLQVEVMRPAGFAGLLEVEYSINIECGIDTMLLVYEVRDGRWRQRLRWQSPPLKSISDAFGDWFLTTVLPGDPATSGGEQNWRMVVAHGTTWCASRFSTFKMDLLAPRPDPASPRVVWHIERAYSRGGDFEPRIKASGDLFELRINADCMEMDAANCFERRVIYRYQVDADDRVRRIGPMGVNARGFVHEWIRAPWEESENLVAAEAQAPLRRVHARLNPPSKADDSEDVAASYGPVRACAAAGVYQVEIDSSLEKVEPGKGEGDPKAAANYYFHVREGKDGYVMVSAPTEPDPACTGPDLMPAPDGST